MGHVGPGGALCREGPGGASRARRARRRRRPGRRRDGPSRRTPSRPCTGGWRPWSRRSTTWPASSGAGSRAGGGGRGRGPPAPARLGADGRRRSPRRRDPAPSAAGEVEIEGCASRAPSARRSGSSWPRSSAPAASASSARSAPGRRAGPGGVGGGRPRTGRRAAPALRPPPPGDLRPGRQRRRQAGAGAAWPGCASSGWTARGDLATRYPGHFPDARLRQDWRDRLRRAAAGRLAGADGGRGHHLGAGRGLGLPPVQLALLRVYSARLSRRRRVDRGERPGPPQSGHRTGGGGTRDEAALYADHRPGGAPGDAGGAPAAHRLRPGRSGRSSSARRGSRSSSTRRT